MRRRNACVVLAMWCKLSPGSWTQEPGTVLARPIRGMGIVKVRDGYTQRRRLSDRGGRSWPRGVVNLETTKCRGQSGGTARWRSDACRNSESAPMTRKPNMLPEAKKLRTNRAESTSNNIVAQDHNTTMQPKGPPRRKDDGKVEHGSIGDDTRGIREQVSKTLIPKRETTQEWNTRLWYVQRPWQTESLEWSSTRPVMD